MTEAQITRAPANRFSVLGLLFVVYTFNFIDRQILGILAPSIKAALNLNDTQLGLLGGLAFALFYTGLGIPIAWLADRGNRTWIMTVSLALWSAFTAACGLVGNFMQLFLARMGVGVGEAGGVAPAYSLISDYFPPNERARALAAYSFGIPVGSAAGIGLGGVLAATLDWRIAFIAVGLAGLVIAPVFKLFVREPARGALDQASGEKASFSGVVRTLGGKPSFWLLSFGAGCCSIMGYGIFFWMPSFLMRSFHFAQLEAAGFYSSILLIGGVTGVWLGGMLADWLGKRSRAAYAIIPACAFIAALPCYVFGMMSPSPALAWLLFLPPTALGLMWLGPVITAIQHLGAPSMRTTASAVFLFINNLIGLGLGTLIIGALSDALKDRFGDEALRYSILAGTGFYLIAAILFLIASRSLKRDWID